MEVFLPSVPVKYRQTLKLKIIGTRGSTCDLGCEETPQLVHTSSTDSGTNGSPTFDNASTKKTFQYKKGPLIGKGSYGEVNECLNLSSGEIIAAKSVKVILCLGCTNFSRSTEI